MVRWLRIGGGCSSSSGGELQWQWPIDRYSSKYGEYSGGGIPWWEKNEKRVVVEEVAVEYGRENWGNYKLIMLIFNFILNWLILFLIHPMCKIRNLQTIDY